MKYGSVCSGIEAASVAWQPLGWKAQFLSEVEKFPCAVLAHHYPTIPNLGDMTNFKSWGDYGINVLVGGTPCQSFSIAGLRKGLDDPRGNLMLTFGSVAAKYRPTWLVWENVYGVLSSNGGRDFASFLGLITGQAIQVPRGGWGNSGIIPGYKNAYGVAYRVLDAQYAGVPQRRRRVFVVGHLGDWRRAAAVLFERHSLSGDPAPSRKTGKDVAGPVIARTGRNGGASNQDVYGGGLIAFGGNNTSGPIETATAVRAKGGTGHNDFESETFIAHPLRGQKNTSHRADMDTYLPVAIQNATRGKSQNGLGIGGDVMFTLDQGSQHAVAFDCKASGRNGLGVGEVASTMRSMGHANSHQNGGGHQAVMTGMQVRRLTPRECERLQGFPDDYTRIHGRVADGPRYKALGNSMAVPVMAWIGERIQLVEDLCSA